MYKAKWLKIEVDCAHKELVAAIRVAQFNETAGYGFDLSFRDGMGLKAKFTEKIAIAEVVTDPYGRSTEFETTRYFFIKFQLYLLPGSKPTSYFMEVSSPPRSLRSLIGALGNIASGLIVSEVDVPVLDVFGMLRKSSPSARLTRIKASQLKLTIDSVAKVDVVSLKNAASDLRRFFGEGEMSVDKIRVERPFGPAAHAMELGRNGLVAVDDSHAEIASKFVLSLLMER